MRRTIPTISYEIPNIGPRIGPSVGFICPACDSEVSFSEIVEKKGFIGCVNCSK